MANTKSKTTTKKNKKTTKPTGLKTQSSKKTTKTNTKKPVGQKPAAKKSTTKKPIAKKANASQNKATAKKPTQLKVAAPTPKKNPPKIPTPPKKPVKLKDNKPPVIQKTKTQEDIENEKKVSAIKKWLNDNKDLDAMTKIKTLLLIIFTLGWFKKYLDDKVETRNDKANDEQQTLKVNEKIPFDINKLIVALGTLENIVDVSSTLSSLKVKTKNIKQVNKDELKSLGCKGNLVSGNNLSLIFGDYSKTLSEAINKKLKKPKK